MPGGERGIVNLASNIADRPGTAAYVPAVGYYNFQEDNNRKVQRPVLLAARPGVVLYGE